MREFIEVGTYTPGSRMVYLTVDSHDTWGYETRCMHVIDTEYAREIV